ncbi:hypothetical protein STVIR_1981 [Streptomyces viridochromogenes Tue57]|uniref:Uncharacterized protein n=1 Tax=Streptomyces viridochromogenes Tue57 TaxID=1160705 RepID=L8PHU5_STRVR|nr:hypothetical protein STVIR_1981 [Streptomyces viridochromogenes Tue57]
MVGRRRAADRLTGAREPEAVNGQNGEGASG